MPDEGNPIVIELMERNRDMIATDDPEAALTAIMERAGGTEVITECLTQLTVVDLTFYPATAMVRSPDSIRQAILSGFCLAIAAMDRVRDIEVQMRDLGME
jgi:hypothetical protein